MKQLMFIVSCLVFVTVFGQNQNTLTLENTLTGKTKTLKLDRASYISLYIDSLDGSNSGGINYTSYETGGNQKHFWKTGNDFQI